MTRRSKIAKIVPIVNPSWPPFRVFSNDQAPLTGMSYIFFKIKNCLNDDHSLVAMTGLEKCCITSAYLQRLCHSGERPMARGHLVYFILFANLMFLLPWQPAESVLLIKLICNIGVYQETFL